MTETSQCLYNPRKRVIDLAIYVPLFLSAFIPLVMIWAYLGGKALPWWSDGGNWLKHMYAILGENRPMWDEGAYQYPPLYFLLLAATYLLLKSETLALKLTAVFVFCLRPITTYILARKLFRGKLPALVAAWLASIPPFAVEMLGWGGYPNLLGLAILPVVFYSILNLMEKTGFKNIVTTLVLALTIALTHHLTFLVFVGTMILWVLALGLSKMKREFTVVGSTLIFAFVFFIAYRLMFAWPNQFILFNEAAYYYLTLTANLGAIMWVFKDRLLLFLLFVTAFLSIILWMEEEVDKEKLTLLVAWVVAPILMSQGHFLGVTMDYLRVFMFTVQPLLIVAATPFSLLNKVIGDNTHLIHSLKRDISAFFRGIKLGRLSSRGRVSGKRLLVFTLVIITLAATSMNLSLGVETVGSVELWCRDNDSYGDGDKLDVTRWILENTGSEDVFVAEERIGRWIEGLARRPVLLYQAPRFLFMEGEAERAYAARSILTSNYGVLNGFIWVLDQTPYGVFSPIIAFRHKGEYEGLLYLDANSTQVEWVSGDGKVCRENLLNASRIDVEWVERSEEKTTLSVRYIMKSLTVERSVRVERAKPHVELSFKVTPSKDGVKPLLLKVCLNEMKDGTIFWGDAEKLPNKTVKLPTYIGPVYIQTTSQYAFPFIFSEEEGGMAEGEIIIQADGSEGGVLAVSSYERREVTVEYGVKYIVLPRNFRTERGMPLSLETETTPIYAHLLKDETLLIAYENTRMIILKKWG